MYDPIDSEQYQMENKSPEPIRTPKIDCVLYDVGRQSYQETLKLQLQLHSDCREGRISGAVVAVEHNAVITLGAKTAPGNLLVSRQLLERQGIELIQTDRGGDITYHGPGQLVAYPILNLKELGNDVHAHLRLMEESIIITLKEFGLKGRRHGNAGVWVGERKICSIGVAVRKWVTYHGLALNISPNMNHFTLINPCGYSSDRMISLAGLLQPCPAFDRVKQVVLDSIAQVFDINLILHEQVGVKE